MIGWRGHSLSDHLYIPLSEYFLCNIFQFLSHNHCLVNANAIVAQDEERNSSQF